MDFLVGGVLGIGKDAAGDFFQDLIVAGKGDTAVLLQVEGIQLGAFDEGFLHDLRRYDLPVEDGAHLQVPLRGSRPYRQHQSGEYQ